MELSTPGSLKKLSSITFEDSFIVWGELSIKGLIQAKLYAFCQTWRKDEWKVLNEPKEQRCYWWHVCLNDHIQSCARGKVWQEDTATSHQTLAALEACTAFSSWVPHDRQSPKLADIWPKENIWRIVKQRVKARDLRKKQQLKNVIRNFWRILIWTKLFSVDWSTPFDRFEAVIAK